MKPETGNLKPETGTRLDSLSGYELRFLMSILYRCTDKHLSDLFPHELLAQAVIGKHIPAGLIAPGMMDTAGCMIAQADLSICKWGLQDLSTLVLAAAEELDELCQAILQAQHEGGDPERIKDECIKDKCIDLGALCLQIMLAYENEHPEEFQS